MLTYKKFCGLEDEFYYDLRDKNTSNKRLNFLRCKLLKVETIYLLIMLILLFLIWRF